MNSVKMNIFFKHMLPSNGFRLDWVVFLTVLLVSSCSTQRHSFAPVIDHRERKAQGRSKHYTVRKGDTLYSIAFRSGNDYRDLAAWNNISAPYTIYVGQKIKLFKSDRAATMRPAKKNVLTRLSRKHNIIIGPHTKTEVITRPVLRPPVPAAIEEKAPAVSVGKPPEMSEAKAPVIIEEKVSVSIEEKRTPITRPEVAEQNESVFDNNWQWPLSGKIVKHFSQSGSKGIDIIGNDGQPVAAAAAGKVVYSGQGLIGYGNLIIIKHSDVYLSAYGNNKRLFVEEGDFVNAGKIIAEIGKISRTMPALHFEIRKEGRPVNPMAYLPKR